MKLNLEATGVHYGLIEDVRRINILRGGTRSSKSYSLMQLVFIWLFTGKVGGMDIPFGNFIIVRATMPALRATVMKDFNQYLIDQGVYGRVDHRKTLNTYYYKERSVEFLSVDDEEKLKGRQSTMFWINEADAVKFDVFNQLLMRCSKYCWIDINPSNSDSWIRTRLEEDRLPNRGDVSLHISTYLDNPYLPPEMVQEIIDLKDTDYELWKIYTKGEWAKLTGKVYSNWQQIDIQNIPQNLPYVYGLDFGFTNDPTVLIRVHHDEATRSLYVEQLVYETGLLNSDIGEKIEEIGDPTKEIVADSSEPKSITELRMLGHNIIKAKKGPDSVKHGINKVKQFKVYVTKESVDLIEELTRYKWRTDANGDPMNEPIDKYNHGLDALRYVTTKKFAGHYEFALTGHVS